MVEKLKATLAAANVEHRNLAVTDVLADFTVLEEDRLDDFLKRLREQSDMEILGWIGHLYDTGNAAWRGASWRNRRAARSASGRCRSSCPSSTGLTKRNDRPLSGAWDEAKLSRKG
jgi:hypothetical protein